MHIENREPSVRHILTSKIYAVPMELSKPKIFFFNGLKSVVIKYFIPTELNQVIDPALRDV